MEFRLENVSGCDEINIVAYEHSGEIGFTIKHTKEHKSITYQSTFDDVFFVYGVVTRTISKKLFVRFMHHKDLYWINHGSSKHESIPLYVTWRMVGNRDKKINYDYMNGKFNMNFRREKTADELAQEKIYKAYNYGHWRMPLENLKI